MHKHYDEEESYVAVTLVGHLNLGGAEQKKGVHTAMFVSLAK